MLIEIKNKNIEKGSAYATVRGFINIIPDEEVLTVKSPDWELHQIRLEEKFGIEINEEDKLVKILAGNSRYSNWTEDPRYSLLVEDEEFGIFELRRLISQKVKGGYFMYLFPDYFPERILKEIKEGDTVRLICNTGVILELTANQMDKRYSYLGRFEEALKKVLM